MPVVYMVKLSEQLQRREVRPTRTRRVLEKQRALRQRRDFQRLQAEAKTIQEQKLSKVQSINEYEGEYNKLSPQLQQFFQSPAELREAEAQKKAEEKQRVLDTADIYQAQLDNLRADLQRNQNKWSTKKRSRVETEIVILTDKAVNLRRNARKVDEGYTADSIISYYESKAEGRGEKILEKKAKRKEQERMQELIEQGYEPILVEKIDKKTGKVTTEIDILGADFKAIPLETKDISKLKSPKTALQRVPVTQQIELGDKTFKFQFDTELKVDKKGKLVTRYGEFEFKAPYGEIVKTEPELKFAEKSFVIQQEIEQKQAREKAIREYVSSIQPSPERPSYELTSVEKALDIAEKDLPSAIGKVGKEATTQPIFTEKYRGELAWYQKWINQAWTGLKSLDLKSIAKATKFNVPVFAGAGGQIDPERLEEAVEKGAEKAEEESQKQVVVKSGLESRYQKIYQNEFERMFYGQLAKEEITFEKAQEEFAETEKAKDIQKDFETELRQYQGQERITTKTLGLTTIKTGAGLYKILPKDVATASLYIGAGYGGYKTLKAVPPVVINIAKVGIGTYGTLKAISPTSSPEDRVIGIVTAGLSFGLLGGQGMRALRKPVIVQKPISVKIKPILPKLRKGFIVPESRTITQDVYGRTILTEKARVGKISQQVITGKRTIVTTKFRKLLGLKPVYQGIPTQQLGKIKVIEGLRGKFIIREPSAYQKAFKLLTKRGGYTAKQAKVVLRYRQPKVIQSLYKGRISVISGEELKRPIIDIKATRDITQPVIDINKKLGIKTRGAVKIKEIIKGRGEVLGTIKEREIVGVRFNIEKAYMKDGRLFQKLRQAGKTTRQELQVSATKDIGESVLEVEKHLGDGLRITQRGKVLETQSNIISQRIIPKGKVLLRTEEAGIIQKKITPKVVKTPFQVKQILKQYKIKPTKTLADYTLKDRKELLQTLKKIYGVNIEQIKPIAKTKLPVAVAQTTPTQTTQQTLIRTIQEPSQNVKQQIKLISKVSQKSQQASAIGLTGIAVSRLSAESIKSAQKPKLSLREVTNLLFREDTAIKTEQVPAEAIAQAQAQRLDAVLTSPQISVPVVTEPSAIITDLPITTPTPTPPITFPFPEIRRIKKKKRKKGKEIELFGKLPDFTTRVLGLDTQYLTENQAMKEVKKILTGLEIRRAVKIKR